DRERAGAREGSDRRPPVHHLHPPRRGAVRRARRAAPSGVIRPRRRRRGGAMCGGGGAGRSLEFFVRVDGGGQGLTRNDYYEAMRRAGLPERAFEQPVRELGRTFQLLLWIAVGLLKNTPVLLIDEPTAGLDLHA